MKRKRNVARTCHQVYETARELGFPRLRVSVRGKLTFIQGQERWGWFIFMARISEIVVVGPKLARRRHAA